MMMKQTRIAVNETFNDLLDNLQPGIVKHHGRTFANHLFLRFTDADPAKSWIGSKLADRIITAKQQLLDVQAFHLDPAFNSQPIVVAALSAKGYNALGLGGQLPQEQGTAFASGMQNRTAVLDNQSTEGWEAGLKADIHCLVIVADSKEEVVKKITRQITAEVTPFGIVEYLQKGKILRNKQKIGIEHFGYADGASQPLFLKDEIEAEPNQLWTDEANPFDILLVAEPGSTGNDRYGSFLVFRKLDQNVAGFKDAEEELSKTFNGERGIKDRNGEPNDELAGAMLVGRFEDGTATIMDSNELGITHEAQLNNDFNYQAAKAADSRCPFHAHIRQTNSRKAEETIRRITRRGIPYNDIGRDEQDLENDKPAGGVGLLFMCYQQDIESQFEAIQQAANKGLDAVIGQPQKDAAGHPVPNPNQLPCQWGNASPAQSVSSFPGYVTLRGGEYFFTPSIPFLKSLKAKESK